MAYISKENNQYRFNKARLKGKSAGESVFQSDVLDQTELWKTSLGETQFEREKFSQ